MTMQKFAIASDHAGVLLKKELICFSQKKGGFVMDLGVDSPTLSVDYPDYGQKAIDVLKEGDVSFAVLICGTGIGMSIFANRFSDMRAALCHTEYEAELSRKHNNANILCLGARIIPFEVAIRCLTVFLTTDFEGGRHQHRLDKIP